MSEKELTDISDNRILTPCWDDDEEFYDFDDEFPSESNYLFQSIEDRELLDPEDDDFYDFEYEY